jgi:hypothetical protein
LDQLQMAKFHSETINPLLSERRIAMLADAVGRLDAGVEAGNVPNTLFTKSKAVINLAVDEAIGEFNRVNRDYGFDTLVLGAYNVPAALKEAVAKGATKRASLLAHMLPLHELLQSAKPHIVKRSSGGQAGTLPASKSKDSMTCQCCARQVCARTGVIAHHGYRRPVEGWQSASCFGARHIPFEAARGRLGDLIDRLRFEMAGEERAVEDVEAERAPVVLTLPDRSKPIGGHGRRPTRTVVVTRDNFDEVRLAGEIDILSLDYESLKARHLVSRRRSIDRLMQELAAQSKRFGEWRKTHAWNASIGNWIALGEEK